ncbi:proton-translocating transhydrogenase family protein [Rickettsia endosymbiont of Cardiosporidium cionae]|uniref:proton-translocating transhydrogenase family protein n=1 Tax=Rickettsia endosymbiont of Cardiosporidium cionae TaxID=2777155 RepID=UPI0018950721|nr:proton-translocating transhydrogenase family protein [Rickettsia endosymbiont of Cardiosporidium cionae]KAF8818128.1 NAD(P) transhydrogenase subunit alpha [Rickettsia endosymbiont of Cardiosporidium cionae]
MLQTLHIPEVSNILEGDIVSEFPIINLLTIFLLSCFVGYYVVLKVTPALHTALISITNAISGIIILAGMITIAGSHFNVSSISLLLSFISIFLAAINIFGGIILTIRMIKMFNKK